MRGIRVGMGNERGGRLKMSCHHDSFPDAPRSLSRGSRIPAGATRSWQLLSRRTVSNRTLVSGVLMLYREHSAVFIRPRWMVGMAALPHTQAGNMDRKAINLAVVWEAAS
jgi:hypothetical protein